MKKIKVNFFQIFWNIISTRKNQKKLSVTKMSTGKPIRVNLDFHLNEAAGSLLIKFNENI